MKKCSIFALAAVLFAGAAHAEFQETVTAVETTKGGFSGGGETIVTTAAIEEMRDDTPVVMQGQIVQRLGDEKYLFKDTADTVTVEIEDDDWRGIVVTPQDTIKIYGEVDRGLWDTEIDVNYIEIVQ